MNVTSNDGSWSEDGKTTWNNGGGVRLGYGLGGFQTGPTTITKGFYMPANTSVKMYVRGKVETTANSSNTFSAKVSGGTVAEAKAESSSWINGATTDFELKDKVGTMIANPLITIIDDPHLENGMGSSSFDGEGVATFSKEVGKI